MSSQTATSPRFSLPVAAPVQFKLQEVSQQLDIPAMALSRLIRLLNSPVFPSIEESVDQLRFSEEQVALLKDCQYRLSEGESLHSIRQRLQEHRLTEVSASPPALNLPDASANPYKQLAAQTFKDYQRRNPQTQNKLFLKSVLSKLNHKHQPLNPPGGSFPVFKPKKPAAGWFQSI